MEEAALRERLVRVVDEAYGAKAARLDASLIRHIEKDVMLRTLDMHWRDHLAAMDYLRQGIHLRGYAQQDYRTEYKREAFAMFSAMLDRVKFETVSTLMQIEVRSQEEVDREEEERRARLMRALQAQHAEAPVFAEPVDALFDGESGAPPPPGMLAGPDEAHSPFVRGERKVGRNEPCPCGSGKKFKHCHGTLSNVG
jgi:preprotein translocase subunit SecA